MPERYTHETYEGDTQYLQLSQKQLKKMREAMKYKHES